MSRMVEFDGVAWQPDHVSMVQVAKYTHTSHEDGITAQRTFWLVEVALIGGQMARIGDGSMWSQKVAEGIATEFVEKMAAADG
jgi:hypothetical protein